LKEINLSKHDISPWAKKMLPNKSISSQKNIYISIIQAYKGNLDATSKYELNMIF